MKVSNIYFGAFHTKIIVSFLGAPLAAGFRAHLEDLHLGGAGRNAGLQRSGTTSGPSRSSPCIPWH